MNAHLRNFLDLFFIMNDEAQRNGAVAPRQLSELDKPYQKGNLDQPVKLEPPSVAAGSLEAQVRDWAALDGYMWREKQSAWEVIHAQMISKAEPVLQEPPVEIPKAGADTESDRMRLERLGEIRDRIQPRLDSANEQGRLERLGITLRGASLMIWIGWLCVTALGWVFSWMLERIVQQGKSSSPAGQSVNDIVALFVASFSKLRDRLIQAFPGYEGYEWMIIILGIALVLFAILAYLHAQRLSGQFQSIESALDIATQGATTPAFEKNLGHYEASPPRVSKRKAKWLIIAVILGLLGFGILLSAVQQGYNTISFIMLGYSLAAVTAAVMMIVVHYTMRRLDNNLENQRYLPDWLYKTLVGVTLGVLVMLLTSLVILTGWAEDFPSALAVFSIGAFLLLGTAALAAGQIHLNIFRNENRWIGVRAQIDRRIHDLQEAIDRPIKEAQNARREQGARKRQAAVEKARIQHELERMRQIFEEAYNRGRTARELQEQRLAREATFRTPALMPALE